MTIFSVLTEGKYGFDVEVWHDTGDSITVNLDPHSGEDQGASQRLTPDQARQVAAELLRLADKIEGK